MEYDTHMSGLGSMRLRSLSNGEEVVDVLGAGWEGGNLLYLTLPEGHNGFSPGVLAQIESDSALYLGEIRQRNGSDLRVLVEHSLNLARLDSMQDNWR
jgi:hypothetical protein